MTLVQEKCIPCRDTSDRLSEADIKHLWLETPMWEVAEEDNARRLRRTFKFDTYEDGLAFAQEIGRLAAEADHHPIITIDFRKVGVEWMTHMIKGLHRNDFIMAARTDQAYLAHVDSLRRKGTVREASEESFPASDAPGWIGGTSENDEPYLD